MPIKSRSFRVFVLACCVGATEIVSIGDAEAGKVFRVIYDFKGGDDGGYPSGTLILDTSGNLYGVTKAAGSTNDGTVFKLSRRKVHTVLHSFSGPDGRDPGAGVIADTSGNLFGTAAEGGNSQCSFVGCGTVFKIAPSGSSQILHKFRGKSPDGGVPLGRLIDDSNGNLYGTTAGGGDNNDGIIFRISPERSETVLYSFQGGSDGANPAAGLIADASGNLYGTTSAGGGSGCQSRGCGTVFKLGQDGNEVVLHAFTGGDDGAIPVASLIADQNGNLYGTTSEGGGSGCGGDRCGTVFRIASDGTETVLHAFQGGTDGATPEAELIMDNAGNLFGTTAFGGGARHCACGTVFELAPDRTVIILEALDGRSATIPSGGLVADKKGNLYGVAVGGRGPGAIFKITLH